MPGCCPRKDQRKIAGLPLLAVPTPVQEQVWSYELARASRSCKAALPSKQPHQDVSGRLESEEQSIDLPCRSRGLLVALERVQLHMAPVNAKPPVLGHTHTRASPPSSLKLATDQWSRARRYVTASGLDVESISGVD